MSQALMSTGFQSASAMFEGVAQNNAYRGMADVDNENAHLAEMQGALNIDDIRRRGRATQGEAIAALGANGTGVESGSAQDLIYQNSLEIEWAALGERYAAGNEANAYRFRAKQERSAGRNAIYGAALRAGAAAITGISEIRNQAQEDAAYKRRYEAYFPGGQRLPMPPPPYNPQYSPGP